MRLAKLLALTVLAAGAARAGEAPAAGKDQPPPAGKLPLTLGEAVGRALRTAERVAGARAGLDRAGAGVGEALSGALPTVSVDGSLTRSKREITDAELAAAALGGPAPEEYATAYAAGVQMTQTLFAGGQVWNAVAGARWGREAAAQGLRSARQATVYAAARCYYDALLAREGLAVRNSTLDLAAGHYRDVEARQAAGAASKFDVLRAKVAMQNQKTEVLVAGNALRAAHLRLLRETGLPQETEPELLTGFARPGPELDLERALQAAARRPDVAASELTVLGQERALRAARAGYFPRVSASARWGGGSSEDPFADDHFTEARSIGVQLQWLPFDGLLTRSRTAAARADLERLRWQSRSLGRDAATDVRQALLRLRSARELMDSEGANVEEATEALRLAGARLAAGAGTELDVQDARAALELARLNHSRAQHQYALGRLDLGLATGTLEEDQK